MKKLRQLSDQIMDHINQFIENAEDNETHLYNTVEEMRKQIQAAKEIVASAIVDEQQLKRAYREAIDAYNRCENRINTLLQNNNEQHVDEIRQQAKKYQHLAHDLEQRIHAQETFIQELKTDLSEIYQIFRSISYQTESLSHKQKQTQIRTEFQKILTEFDLIDVDTALKRDQEKLEMSEVDVKNLEDNKRKSDQDFNIDDALADLKREILGSSQND